MARRADGVPRLAWITAFVLIACTDDPSEPRETISSFELSAPASVEEGQPFELSVTAVGSFGSVPFSGFTGDVELRVSEGQGHVSIDPVRLSLSNGTGSTEAAVFGVVGEIVLEATAAGATGSTSLTLEADTLRRLLGRPDAPATEAIPDRRFEAREEDYSAGYPGLGELPVASNVMVLSLTGEATIAEVNELLATIDSEIAGGLPGKLGEAEAIVAVRLPSSSHDELAQLVAELQQRDIISNVVVDALLQPSYIPGPNVPEPGQPDRWLWTLTPSSGNWGLEFVRVPQMWNLNDGIAASGNTAVTGILDSGFAENHPDLIYDENQTPGNDGWHGTQVAGVIGATFDNGIGVDGLNPFADLVVRHTGGSFVEVILNDIWTMLMSRPDIRVLNLSLAYDWGENCWEAGDFAPIQELVAEQAALFRGVLQFLRLVRPLPLIVSSAGNCYPFPNPPLDARWGSPFNYAALVLEPPRGSVSPGIVVEGMGWGFGSSGPPSRTADTNVGGHVSAPGVNVYTTFSLPGHATQYNPAHGTSVAAAHVTGLIGYLYAIDPGLTHAEIRELLESNSVEVSGFSPPANWVDAYATALDIDRIREGTAVRRMLLDVANDGAFEEADIEAFLEAFDAYAPFDLDCSIPPADSKECPIYSRFNLNGTGIAGGDDTGAFDLDRDGSYGTVTIEIEGDPVSFDESALTDLEILCYYAYSSVYAGPAAARTALLGSRCGALAETSFQLDVVPGAAEVVQGGSVDVTVGIIRIGFDTPVTVTLTGLPMGVTADPLSLDAGTAEESGILTLNADQAAALGFATATVEATAAGVQDRTAPLEITVIEPPPGESVAWTFCEVTGIPEWLAVQDGSGEWISLSPEPVPGVPQAKRYVFEISEGRGGVEWVSAS